MVFLLVPCAVLSCSLHTCALPRRVGALPSVKTPLGVAEGIFAADGVAAWPMQSDFISFAPPWNGGMGLDKA